MNRDEYLASIAKYIGRLAYEVRALNAMGRFDINSTVEDFLVPILKLLFDCPELRNQNEIQQNFPAVDLGCRKARISFQVTTDASSAKVIKTLEKFTEHGLGVHFDAVYVITLTEKQASYGASALDRAISALPVQFSKSDHILDLEDILSRTRLLDTGELSAIDGYLKSEFEKIDEHSRFRENLDQFLAFSTQKIDVEKSSKKYIPAIFVETHLAKEEIRAFAHPLFFYRKVQDALAGVDYRRLNALFALAKEPELSWEVDGSVLVQSPATYEQLATWSEAIGAALDGELAKVRPLSWRREDGDPQYAPRDKDSAGWSIVRFRVEVVATGLTQRLLDARTVIRLLQKKIFLITSMAGQGKTNFVCDLIESQFDAFEIPCIFIPARELNSYPSRARILSFISNNRYSPNFTRVHEYLDLFDKIGKDIGKPFMIVIDGINEVKALEEFSDELREFCGAVCQYDFVRLVGTCRSEFFDEKYASILNEPYGGYIHRVTDLRAKMSEASKDRLLAGYLRHFNVTGRFTGPAEEFLKNDLLLLRIFCERHEGRDVGHITEIYKGDLFEDFLVRKFRSFPERLQAKALPTLTKIAAAMLAADDYAKLSVRDFAADEQEIVQLLVADDVILRQEIAEQGLASLGDLVVSFTYDELRDFVIAYKLVEEVTADSADNLDAALSRLPERPIYEGVYKYAYLLARKANKPLAIAACERAPEFIEHFTLNVHLLPPDAQNDADVERVRTILSDTSVPRRVIRVAQFLIRRSRSTAPLNVTLLLDHLNALEAEAHQAFIRILFSDSYGFDSREWRGDIGKLVDQVWEASSEEGLGRYLPRWLAFFLHASSYAWWPERERVSALFRNPSSREPCEEVLALVRPAKAEALRSLIAEIEAPEEAERWATT
jgi:hypothetical protein